MRHDGRLVLKLVAVSEPKIVSRSPKGRHEIEGILKNWAPDGGPYVGRGLSEGYSYSDVPYAKMPDRLLHFELSGEGPQSGWIYVKPNEALSPKVGLVDGFGRARLHGYFMNESTANRLVLPYFSGGQSSTKVDLALTKANFQTIAAYKAPFKIDTSKMDKEFDRLWKQARSLKGRIMGYRQPSILHPLAHGRWGSVGLRITNSFVRLKPFDAHDKAKQTAESKFRNHSVHVQFKAAVPLKYMVRTTVFTKDGKKRVWINESWMSTSASDPGPNLEDIEKVEIAVCPFKFYSLSKVELKPNPAKYAGAFIGPRPPRSTVCVPGVANIESTAAYDIRNQDDWAVQVYTPDGKPWHGYPGEERLNVRPGSAPRTVYEIRLMLDKVVAAKDASVSATAWLMPSRKAKGKLKPFDFASTYPGFRGQLSLSGEAAKGDSHIRIDLQYAVGEWKPLGKTAQYIELEKRLLEQNAEWVHKWMTLTPLLFWINESGELMLSYTEPRKAPKTVPTGIKLPNKECQGRLAFMTTKGERVYCPPFTKNQTVHISFNLNEQREAAYSANGEHLYLKDLRFVELQFRPIIKTKPLIVKIPPPVRRSKPMVLEAK